MHKKVKLLVIAKKSDFLKELYNNLETIYTVYFS